MDGATFIGDEFTGAGFRLAGLRVLNPDPERLLESFRQALVDAPLLLLSREVADLLPKSELYEAILKARPPVAVVAAAAGSGGEAELVREVRIALGMEA